MATSKRGNRVVARVIPVVLVGLVAYAAYVFTKPLCIDYLIYPSRHYGELRPRRNLAAGLLTAFYLLLLMTGICYLRVITTIIGNPGFLPRGHKWAESHNAAPEKPVEGPYPIDAYGLEAFYCKDVFICQEDGRPPWCSTCFQWKTDRAHHCSEVNRCTRKLDHFCPWVGGVISELSFKFFIQFVFYTFLFMIFNIAVLAVFVAELRTTAGDLEVQWIVMLALSGLFFLFSLGMLTSSLHLAWLNVSTIESLTTETKVWTLAILISRPKDFHDLQSRREKPVPVVIYPSSPIRSVSTPISQNSPSREFAIVSTKPGENPFDLGSPLANLQDVMGYTLLDWLLPIKYSPCSDHSRQESAYTMGPVVERLKKEYCLEGHK